MPGDFLAIEKAIKEAHGECEVTYLCSRKVTEMFQGRVVWDGVVDVFTLSGCTTAKRCYGWQYQEDGVTKTVTVLEIPPVDSAETAVKVAIAAKARQ
jgi:hypothetical protein